MKILILGSEGFIGSNLVNYYLSKGVKVHGCDLFERPLNNYQYFKVSRLSPEWEEIFSSSPYTVCINAAGSGNVPYSMSHPLVDFESNGLDVIRVLDAIRRFCKECLYVHLSSAAVYGNPKQLPVTEHAPLSPLSPYGWHKWMSELVCQEYFRIYGIHSFIVRPFSVYGPGLRKQLFWDLFDRAQGKERVELFGTGNESRDFIFINDMVAAIDLLLQKGSREAQSYNLASGTETSIEKAASIFLKQFTSPPKLVFNGQVKAGDPLNWRADISKIKELGFQQQTSLEKGIELTHNWISNHINRHDR